jgi:hypothetical protein
LTWDRWQRIGGWVRAHPTMLTGIGPAVVIAALVIGLWSKRGDFAEAAGSVSLLILGGAVLLQVAWLLLRSEAWHVCVGAAGGRVGRTRLYRASSLGYLGNVFNANFGLALRIAALRRAAPADSPRPSVLVGAEVPILLIEGALAAVMSFTLIGPLGLPWWLSLASLVAAVALIGGLNRLGRVRKEAFWKGLAVMRGLGPRNTIVALVALAVSAQVARNWLVLTGIGVDISVLDAVALLIATAAIGILPIGPGIGAGAAVLILGSSGAATVAAAGALLTATSVLGAFCFAAWGFSDRLRRSPPPATARVASAPG